MVINTRFVVYSNNDFARLVVMVCGEFVVNFNQLVAIFVVNSPAQTPQISGFFHHIYEQSKSIIFFVNAIYKSFTKRQEKEGIE